ncbi:16030_t:CDS:2, partial [Entrophospora sp. SA101]
SVIDGYLENYELRELRNKRHVVRKDDENSPLLESTLNDLMSIQFDSTEINELSSLISQLLLLSRKGHKYLILKGIIIIHVNFVITQDQELGDESLRYMKSSKASLLAPFNLYCLLSMARIHRFQDSISFQLSKVTYNE